ncbi:MAG: hypothetical protein K9N55_15565 [Phycisphaerae bacterium]|nr:hypothetical protein [Phycisphaerae bacterium]
MTFWTAVLIGLIVAFIYSRRGLYEALILAFNLGLSLYLSLFLTPKLLTEVPTAADIPGGLALVVLIVFAMSFGLLFAVSFVLFTGQFSVAMAKALDWLGGGITGFFTGFLGTHFLLMVLTLAPIPGVPGFAQDMDVTTSTQIVCSACDKINYWIGADRSYSTQDLLAWFEKKGADNTAPRVDPNADPNEAPIL